MADNWMVKVRASGRVAKVDCQHLPHPQREVMSPLSVAYDRARAYWRGELTDRSQLELLLVGTVRVEEEVISMPSCETDQTFWLGFCAAVGVQVQNGLYVQTSRRRTTLHQARVQNGRPE